MAMGYIARSAESGDQCQSQETCKVFILHLHFCVLTPIMESYHLMICELCVSNSSPSSAATDCVSVTSAGLGGPMFRGKAASDRSGAFGRAARRVACKLERDGSEEQVRCEKQMKQ
eukprot:g36863.t1